MLYNLIYTYPNIILWQSLFRLNSVFENNRIWVHITANNFVWRDTILAATYATNESRDILVNISCTFEFYVRSPLHSWLNWFQFVGSDFWRECWPRLHKSWGVVKHQFWGRDKYDPMLPLGFEYEIYLDGRWWKNQLFMGEDLHV